MASRHLQVVVGSKNPVKVGAVREAFAALFPKASLDVTGVTVDSGVGNQPDSDANTRRGARERVRRARDAEPGADFWVGIEGGVETYDAQLMAFAWMAVGGPAGDISQARSATLPLPPAVMELVNGGMELGEANDTVFATVNSKQGGGAYGLLTGGRFTRAGIYAQTLIIALTPFVNRLYPQCERQAG